MQTRFFLAVAMMALASVASAGEMPMTGTLDMGSNKEITKIKEEVLLGMVAKDAAASFELAKRAAFEVAYRPDKAEYLPNPSGQECYHANLARLAKQAGQPGPKKSDWAVAICRDGGLVSVHMIGVQSPANERDFLAKVVPLVKPSNGTVTLIDYRDGSARLTVYDLLPSPSLAPFGAAAVVK